jgi:hypothetical protein
MPRNHRLDDAIRQRSWDVHAFAEVVEVDPKTAVRWISTGRVPHPRLRQRAAEVLGVPGAVLWPDRESPASGVGELVGLYPTRTELSPATIRALLAGAVEHVDVLAYAGLWLWDAVPGFVEALCEKVTAGVEVRICLGDPDSDAVLKRGDEEGIGDNLAARCRLALAYAQPLVLGHPGSVRCSDATLYASLLRFDDDVFVNVHLWGNPAAASPVLHLHDRSTAGVAASALRSFERVWETAQPVVG